MSHELAFFAILCIVVFGPILMVVIDDWRVTLAGVILAGIAIAKIVTYIDPSSTRSPF